VQVLPAFSTNLIISAFFFRIVDTVLAGILNLAAIFIINIRGHGLKLYHEKYITFFTQSCLSVMEELK
jgi:hypothetical protein